MRLVLLILWCLSPIAWSWNAVGHRMIAYIAYQEMTPAARQEFEAYNKMLDKVYKPVDWINAAVWLDTFYYQSIPWFNSLHYVNLPYSEDHSPLVPPDTRNAVWGIKHALEILNNKYATKFDKGVALRIILHLVGDIHQPMHAITRISKEHPKGDRGGNLYLLAKNPIAKNLHGYWDCGGGFLRVKQAKNVASIKKKAEKLREYWPCDQKYVDMNIDHWLKESHQIAISKAYGGLKITGTPDKKYKRQVVRVTEERIALAGCRLAALLNESNHRNTLS